ncbi:carbon-nitrogen family hydrolase [Staphylococcus durrellii]|uniref:carbon-nitrogen family hydrolase n=1 Tax=Staphylococcus durrellii TaxID=2781773 RepID=UPI00189D856F|nr:carbon-nitrogen family hydrolase [Staphylococcus durrellii]MBF7016637.1 carbon-nitrogen family hydrolase [Staphylococcus durrellii]
MNIKVFQLKIEPADVTYNEQNIKSWFNKHMQQNTDVVVLPEMWNNGYALSQLDILADTNLNRSYEFIKKLALQYNVDIVAGSVSNKRNGQVYNTAFTVLKDGTLVNVYDKVHLVPMLNEPAYLAPGEAVPEPYKLSNGVQSTQIICYDLRFPELLRYPAAEGCEIAFYVAQWPQARLKHWQSLIQARAIENDMYVVGCNACGDDGNTQYAGHSMVVNPNGEILEEVSGTEKCITLSLDLDKVRQQRSAIPVFENRRKALYK